MRAQHTTGSEVKRTSFVLALLALSIAACTDPKVADGHVTGKWLATQTTRDVLVKRTEYVLELNLDFSYHMESEQSRKVDDYDYYAKIASSEREYDGQWEISDDGKTITFILPELEGDERLSNFDGMELTVSEDGETLTRSDINARAALLVFSRD